MATEETELQRTASTQIPGIIPHFYYDLIGRILPGSYLMFGLLVLSWNGPELKNARDHMKCLRVSEANGSFLIFVLSVSVLVLVSSAYLVGFVFGAVSFFVEIFWRRRSPKNLHDLATSFGMNEGQEASLRAAFKQQFHFELEEKEKKDEPEAAKPTSKVTPAQHLTESSSLCSYYVWANAPNLGYMTSRWDAETLASRSLFSASLILVLLQVVIFCFGHRNVGPVGLITFCVVGSIAFLQYGFQRRKQIQGRFSLFQALTATLHARKSS